MEVFGEGQSTFIRLQRFRDDRRADRAGPLLATCSVLKALCLGAKGVGLGRAMIYAQVRLACPVLIPALFLLLTAAPPSSAPQ